MKGSAFIMAKTVQDIMNLIREQDIKMVDFKMVDINGQYRHVTIPAKNFSEATMKNGIGFDASNYGYAVVEKSDMVFIPDPDTAVIDPFCNIPYQYKGERGYCQCSVENEKGGSDSRPCVTFYTLYSGYPGIT